MSVDATVRVPTPHASRYLQQVCKHWAHNLAVTFDAGQGRIVFPRDARGASWTGDAVVTFVAEPDALHCTIAASEAGQRDGLKGAVARHVDRFAFREGELAWDWVDG
ncbi:MAG: DUF2218 domain-containing protein [Sphingomonadales bacterium]|nr:DUF2218 domain-containing protein [Sphingomonadales bacterium]